MTDRLLTESLPTHADIRRWRADLDHLIVEEAEMRARHAREEARLKAIRAHLQQLVELASALADVLGDAAVEQITSPEPPSAKVERPTDELRNQPRAKKPAAKRRGTQTWTATIERIVKEAGVGMTYPELRDAVSKTHLGETLARTDKAFYGGISKLEARGRLVRHNGRVFSPAAFKRFTADVKAGRAEDIPYVASSAQESPNEIAVRRLLTEHPKGMTTAEIVNSLLANPPADLAVSKNRNSLYNLLARERERGNLVQRGEKYFLPESENEPELWPHKENDHPRLRVIS